MKQLDDLRHIRGFSVNRVHRHGRVASRLQRSTGVDRLDEQAPTGADYQDGKQHLHLNTPQGRLLAGCASMSADYVCCNMKVLAAVSNCPYECSYCFLQNYLTDTTLSVPADNEPLLEALAELSHSQPGRLHRVGTWELGDSLALEPLTGSAGELIEAVARLPNIILELRTKSDHVDELLNLEHGGRTVLAWTMNPQVVVRGEEYRTASVAQRLQAMARAQARGYPIGIHFDPMIHCPDWEAAYGGLVEEIARAVPADRVAWISTGSLRFNPEMKRVMEDNYPGSRATLAEMVLGGDGKMRYVKPLRISMYRSLLQALKQEMGEELPFVYLCMERWDMWHRLFGRSPHSIDHLDWLMARSLWQRFPEIGVNRPERMAYGL